MGVAVQGGWCVCDRSRNIPSVSGPTLKNNAEKERPRRGMQEREGRVGRRGVVGREGEAEGSVDNIRCASPSAGGHSQCTSLSKICWAQKSARARGGAREATWV